MMTSKALWGICYTLALFVNFRLLCENTKASKPIVINVLSRICGERKIILKSMQDKDKAVWACGVCVCVCVVWCVWERERGYNIRFIKAYCMQFRVGWNRCHSNPISCNSYIFYEVANSVRIRTTSLVQFIWLLLNRTYFTELPIRMNLYT